MTSGCYVLRLECDARLLRSGSGQCLTFQDYQDDDEMSARDAARKAGWLLVGPMCWCSTHANRTQKQRSADRRAAWGDNKP